MCGFKKQEMRGAGIARREKTLRQTGPMGGYKKWLEQGSRAPIIWASSGQALPLMQLPC